MPPSYVTIPRSEYLALMRELRRASDVLTEIATFRLALQELMGRSGSKLTTADRDGMRRVFELAAETGRLRVEITAVERRLREFDQELTPIRPPSSADIQAAFKNATDFASGARKPGDPESG